MTIEDYTLLDGTQTKKITASEGMTCVRTADGIDFGTEVILGYRYRDEHGNLLDEKVLEVPSDFHEEEIPEEEEEIAEEMYE